MILTVVILVLFALFWVAELVAHLTKYKYGMTLSALVWKLERETKGHGLLSVWPRIVIAALVALLFTHLEFQVP